MKSTQLFLLLIVMATITTSFKIMETKKNVTECDVVNFFEVIEPESGVKVLTSDGDLEEVELILIPTIIEEGSYNIEITRKGSNIYKLEGTKYYIETRFCFEYTMFDEAILKVDSNYGYTNGTVYFD